MHDVPVGDRHGAGSGASSADIATIITRLQNMQVQQDERYTDKCQRQVTFEGTQIEQYNMMQQHLSTQDSNFEAFSSYVTETLVSLHSDMNANHEVILAKINHIISTYEDESHRYERFYKEMCEVIDSQYRNEE